MVDVSRADFGDTEKAVSSPALLLLDSGGGHAVLLGCDAISVWSVGCLPSFHPSTSVRPQFDDEV